QSSDDSSSIFICGKMPALAHNMSMPPCAATAASAITCMSPILVTSPAWPLAVPPARRNSSAQASASSRWRDTTSTLPPLRAKTVAIPLPIPLLAPVTMTDRPAIDVNMTVLHNTRRQKAPFETKTGAASATPARIYMFRGNRAANIRPSRVLVEHKAADPGVNRRRGCPQHHAPDEAPHDDGEGDIGNVAAEAAAAAERRQINDQEIHEVDLGDKGDQRSDQAGN